MKAAFQVSEQHVERFRQASVRIRECLSAVEGELPPDAGVWREAAIAGLLQAYGATIAALEINVASTTLKEHRAARRQRALAGSESFCTLRLPKASR
jgi:hypothetical protein